MAYKIIASCGCFASYASLFQEIRTTQVEAQLDNNNTTTTTIFLSIKSSYQLRYIPANTRTYYSIQSEITLWILNRRNMAQKRAKQNKSWQTLTIIWPVVGHYKHLLNLEASASRKIQISIFEIMVVPLKPVRLFPHK